MINENDFKMHYKNYLGNMKENDIMAFMTRDYTFTQKDGHLEIKFNDAFRDGGDSWQLWIGVSSFAYNCGIAIVGGLSGQRSTYKRPELTKWVLDMMTSILLQYYGEVLYSTNGNEKMEKILKEEGWKLIKDTKFKNPNTSKPITLWLKKREN